MQRCLGTAAALLAWASSALALRPHAVNPQHTGAHVHNIANESFEVNQLGEHVLLRVPPEAHKEALFQVSGHFAAHPLAPCYVFTDIVTLSGSYLGNQTLHLWYMNKSLHIKVSTLSPVYAGPWRSIHNYTVARDGPEAKPRKLGIAKMQGNTGFAFYVGRPQLPERPVIQVAQGLRKGLDVSFSNLQAFGVGKVAGLLGSYKHNKTVEKVRYLCEHIDHLEAISARVDHVEGAMDMKSTHLRNLAHEKFIINQPGLFVLLRVPRAEAGPALISVRGSFVSTLDDPCVVYLQRLTMLGSWFGNKTVHVSAMAETLNIKVSTPEVAGKVQSVKNFVEHGRGLEALPHTVKVTGQRDGPFSPSFKFQLGSKRLNERANILVTLTHYGGLDIKVVHMERVVEGEVGGLLGMDSPGKAVVTPSKECMGKLPNVDVPEVNASEQLSFGSGSLLTASWDA